MDDRDQELLTLLSNIISMLSEPLSLEERERSWTEGLKRGWLASMQKIHGKIEKGLFKENFEKEINFTRDLGWEGVVKGELADLILRFDEKWNEKYAEKPDWWWRRKEGKLGKIDEPPRKNFK